MDEATQHPPVRAAAAVPGLDPLVSLAMCVHAGPGVFALLLGAGMSRAAGIPTGWDIVTDLVRRAALARGTDPVEAAAAAADPQGWWAEHGAGGELGYSGLLELLGGTPAARHQLLGGYFEATGQERADGLKQPGPAHRAVAELVARGSVRVVLTTNFDRLTEQALQAAGVQPQVISSPDGLRGMTPLAHARATVVKLHGDLADLESRNTERELDAYPAAWAGLVDQVLDEYGLLVCGWSAQWDHALVRCFERRSARRYPVFWSTASRPGERAAELISRHQAVLLDHLTADQLFTGLTARLGALDRLAAPPPTRELAVARLKRALLDPARRIELHDLVDGEGVRVVERLAGRDRADAEGELAAGRQESDILLHLLAAGAFHDREGAHARLWVRTVQRLLDLREDDRALRHYPALLALAAAGPAAVLAGREDVLGRLLLEPSWDGAGRRAPGPAALVLHPGELFGDGALLGGTPERHAVSRRLREEVRPALAEATGGSARSFREAFDRYEYLTALVQADLDQSPFAEGEFTLPDRWDQEGRLRVADRVRADLTPGWPMLAAGAFGGDLRRAHAAAAVVDTECARRRESGETRAW